VQIAFGLDDKPESAEEALEHFFEKDYYKTLAQEDELFAEYPSRKQREYIRSIVLGTVEHFEEFDDRIEKYTRGWKLSRISRIAVVIIRTAMFEVLYMDEVPDRVAINEAVELAKGYEEQETVAFINGILGSFMREERGTEIDVLANEEAGVSELDTDDNFEDTKAEETSTTEEN
ncbi:MAG: transcription antitermination factor NusB, partial [Oscillospiraceae bacterium]